MPNRPGISFDLYGSPELDINIQDLYPGKEVQVDGGFVHLEKFAIYMVEATSEGRLFLTDKNGSPFFLDDFIEETGGRETHGHLAGIYDPAVVVATTAEVPDTPTD